MRFFNLLLNPWLYGLLVRVPGLKIGATHFHPQVAIRAMDDYRKRLFKANLRRYAAQVSPVVDQYDGLGLEINSLCQPDIVARRTKFLRYPVLCKSELDRDRILNLLTDEGLGGTAMYQTALSEIEGVPDKVQVSGELKNAKSFARRLVTLPIHERIDSEVATKIINLVVK